MNDLYPIKHLSQNYITDKNTVNKFVSILKPLDNKHILEIGPGTGAITNNIYKQSSRLILIDIDNRVIEPLSKKFPESRIIHGDILNLDLSELAGTDKLTVVGNIPFKITSPILFKLINEIECVDEAIFIIQNEVAKRITAKIGEKDYGILSVLLNYFGLPEYCFKISSNVFYPKPKVDSAAIKIKFKRKFNMTSAHFIKVVKAAFGNRRKTLKNSLTNSIFRNCDFTKVTIDLSRRAETLTIDEFEMLAQQLDKSS
jgi:16S rRNA (adenine1518-N6/adenine1519-N6)-dimethyltransferase